MPQAPSTSPTPSPSLPPSPPSSAIYRVFAILFLVLGAAAVSFTARDLLPFLTQDQSGIIRSLWAQDLENLSSSSLLPEGWLHLHDIKFSAAGNEKENQALLDKVRPFIPTHPDGQYRLNVLFDQWVDSDTRAHAVMIQYSLFNLKSGNLEWELGRTLPLNEAASKAARLNQKPPASAVKK